MDRRHFTSHLLLALAACGPARTEAQQPVPSGTLTPALWAGIEASATGRLGVAVLDTGTGQWHGHRLDERFPMCSTFKWLAAALVLHRVDAGQEQLGRRVRFGREVLIAHSPITALHAGRGGMTMAQLCEATVTVSDNAAGNLILQSFGGPEALTRYARTLGDTMTRLDRLEPHINEAAPGDPRDSTTPRAMATAMQAAVVGNALSPASRERLVAWLEASKTNGKRLLANLPAGWRMGSKTGTGDRGTTNDVGVFWPPDGRPPLVVAVYLTDATASEPARLGAVARVAAAVTAGA